MNKGNNNYPSSVHDPHSMNSTRTTDTQTILVVSVSGIGNTLLAMPLLEALHNHYPQARIDLLVWSRAAGTPFENSRIVSNLVIAPRRIREWIKLMLTLRKNTYDLALTVFPSNKTAFHLFLFLTGARWRLSHTYKGGWRRGEWLLTHRIPAQENLHDVDQNLALLRTLGVNPGEVSRTPVFHLQDDDRKQADAWICQQGIERRKLIGMHPGAGAAASLKHWQGDHKRWPRERFAELAGRLVKDMNCTVLLTGGPEEDELKAYVQQASRVPEHVLPLSGSLTQTAALLARCRGMITNDSGLMHVAAAVGTPVIALFGPTQPGRTAPVGSYHRIIRKDNPCSPCLKYPFESASSRIRCACNGMCLKDISVDEVMQHAISILNQGTD